MRSYNFAVWRTFKGVPASAALALLLLPEPLYAARLIQPRVLITATYETGKDTGDAPGLQHPLLTDTNRLYAMVSGIRCSA